MSDSKDIINVKMLSDFFRSIRRYQLMILLMSLFSFLFIMGKAFAGENVEQVNTFLPIITAWIGAIIAYCFSDKLTEAYTRAMKDSVKDTAKSSALEDINKSLYPPYEQKSGKNQYDILFENLKTTPLWGDENDHIRKSKKEDN